MRSGIPPSDPSDSVATEIMLRDSDWVEFLQWSLPQLGLRWEGYRRMRRQVCRRIARRVQALELPGLVAYKRHLEQNPDEWSRLDCVCRVTSSRFFRDQGVFEGLRRFVLPRLATRREAAGHRSLRVWSAGCASGEEPYTVKLLWDHDLSTSHPDLQLEVVATDSDEYVLRRAEVAKYPSSSLKDLPLRWRHAFAEDGDEVLLTRPTMQGVHLQRQDLRKESPPGSFSLILCRNVAFTYFDESVQRQVLRRLMRSLEPAGFLVLGNHERLPRGNHGMRPCAFPGIFEKVSPITRAVFPDAVLRPWRPD